jgi:hypothetical protein
MSFESTMESQNSTGKRFDELSNWYDKHSKQSQYCYKGLKLLEILAAALIPLMARDPIYSIWSGALGVLIVVLESVQGLFQFHSNWIRYRATWEMLNRERHLCLAKAGPYSDNKDVERTFAERIEAIVSSEYSNWIETERKSGDKADRSNL